MNLSELNRGIFMLYLTRKNSLLLAILLLFASVLAACGSDNEDANASDNLGEKKLTIPYVSWATEIGSSHVIKEVLEEVGYDVTLKEVNTGAMYISVAEGAADAMVSAWLPYTDISYWEKFEDDVVDLGPSLQNAPLGLYVPSYMDIDSIEDLTNNKNNVGESTDWTVTGIDPGSGQMQITEEAMEVYELDKWNLQGTSDAMMIAALDRAIEREEEIVVTLWSPHWIHEKHDMTFLEDPRGVFGEPDDIRTLARKGLEEDSPAAFKVLEQFEWEEEHLESVLVDMFEGKEPEEAAKIFVEENKELVEKWTDGAL